jgi:hypothetical protein
MSAGASGLYSEEGQMSLRVSPGHAISEQWLHECAPELYARWWDAPSLAARDEVALQIEKRLEELEAAESWEKLGLRHQAGTPRSTLADRVAGYEAEASRVGAIPLEDQVRRPAAHLADQASGDALGEQLAAAPAEAARDLLIRRLDAADLVADRPFIEAMSKVSVDRLAVAALSAAAEDRRAVIVTERIQAEMIAEDRHAALRADVPLTVTAGGHDLGEVRELVSRHGVDLGEVAPALVPASDDIHARQTPAIEARPDCEIVAPAGSRICRPTSPPGQSRVAGQYGTTETLAFL